MSKEPDIKLEKHTLWTSIHTYGSTNIESVTALTEIYEALSETEIVLLASDTEDFELITKKNKTKP